MKKLLIIIFSLLLTACTRTAPVPTATPHILINPAVYTTPTPTKWLSPMAATAKAYYEPTLTAAVFQPQETAGIRIDGLNFGQYGRNVSLSVGPDEFVTSICYFVPSGSYQAINNRNNRDQINVYSSQTVFTDGYEYSADSKSYLIEPGASVNIYVPSGYYITVVPPSDFILIPLK